MRIHRARIGEYENKKIKIPLWVIIKLSDYFDRPDLFVEYINQEAIKAGIELSKSYLKLAIKFYGKD